MQLGDRDESVDGHELAGRRIYEVFHARIRAGKWPTERHVLALRRPLVRARPPSRRYLIGREI